MFSKPLAFGLLALGCVTAAAGGAYLATRHNTADVTTPAPAAAATAPAASAVAPASQPVAETEALVAEKAPTAPPTPEKATAPSSEPANSVVVPGPSRRAPAEKSRNARVERPSTATPVGRTVPARDGTGTPAQPDPAVPAPTPVQTAAAPTASEPAKPVDPQPEPVHVPQFEEAILPASSIIGLQVDTPLSSERARVEDRVEARVTRDVMANGRVAIPAGSRVLGSVTLVDKGGKLKERARLGIRFHTLVLADGSDVPLQTEPVYREGESPAGDSAKKIGGAAAVGAILGAIIGGGKGAVVGGSTGAAGGTAAVMAGDRNPATIAPGSIVSVRLSSPVTIQVERRELQ